VRSVKSAPFRKVGTILQLPVRLRPYVLKLVSQLNRALPEGRQVSVNSSRKSWECGGHSIFLAGAAAKADQVRRALVEELLHRAPNRL
jgi:hypothetical protein